MLTISNGSTKGELTVKDRMAIPQMEMPAQDPKVRARNMNEVALGYTEEQAQYAAGVTVRQEGVLLKSQ